MSLNVNLCHCEGINGGVTQEYSLDFIVCFSTQFQVKPSFLAIASGGA
ncbi:hypothetical protein LC612_40555 [Nostoc sp. CHAB 5834]|nr:hypothetical protein [Nostoc sp. CHAB 5834]